jgi:hypothetical protein
MRKSRQVNTKSLLQAKPVEREDVKVGKKKPEKIIPPQK